MKQNNYSPLTKMKYEIVGVSIDIFDKLGPDHQEELYDGDFLVALEVAGFEVTNKPEIEIFNTRNEHLKFYYPDLRVQKEDMLMLIELKADPKGIQPGHIRKARAYLKVSPKDQAILLINFARAKGSIPENKSVFRREL